MSSVKYIKNEDNVNFTPLYFGSENCRPGYAYGPFVRVYYLIHFVVSGCGVFRANGVEYTVMQNEMFVIKPGTEYFYQADAENPWSYIWIGFESNEPLDLPEVIFCPAAYDVFMEIKKCPQYINEKTMYLKSMLWKLFATLADQQEYPAKHIENALKIIHSNYMNEDFSIKDISDILNISRTHFSYLFKEQMKISPKEYLLNLRMKTAASLLNIYHKPVALVAKSVGYSDPYAFSKVFKKHFGVPPSEYEKQEATHNREFFDIHLNPKHQKEYDPTYLLARSKKKNK